MNKSKPTKQEKAKTKEIKDITFDLVEMIMRMATSKKKKETFYVSKVAEKLDKLIANELERQRGEIIEFFDIELEAWMQVHDEQNRSFDTQSLVKHMKKALKTL